VLDQSPPTITNAAGLVSDTVNFAQTFTDGVTGKLDQVDVRVARAGAGAIPLVAEIRSVSAARLPTGPVMASETVPAASVPLGFPSAFFSVPLAPALPVAAGVKYAIVPAGPSDAGSASLVSEEAA
jgi:hypothetical protein